MTDSTPTTQDVATQTATPSAPATQSRKVSILLWLGIFAIPIIFAWFLLGRGYSKRDRTIAFIWMFLYVGLSGRSNNADINNNKAHPVAASQQAPQQERAVVKYAETDQLSETVSTAHRAANLMDRIGGSDPTCNMLAGQIRARANQMSNYDGASPSTRTQAAQQLAITVKQFMAEGNERGCYGSAP